MRLEIKRDGEGFTCDDVSASGTPAIGRGSSQLSALCDYLRRVHGAEINIGVKFDAAPDKVLEREESSDIDSSIIAGRTDEDHD